MRVTIDHAYSEGMLRLPLLVPAIAIATLLAAAPAAVAPAASPETGTIVTVELKLQASDGLQAKLETSDSDDEMVTLELERKGRRGLLRGAG